jgi:hypothetical protein
MNRRWSGKGRNRRKAARMGKMNEIMIYQSDDRKTQVEVRFEQDMVWLTQQQMASLFEQTKQNRTEHQFAYQQLLQRGRVIPGRSCQGILDNCG